MPPSRASAMTLPVDGPMPGQVEQRAVGVALRDLVVAQLAHEVARLGVGLHPAALGQRPVEQVHDAVERVGRATWWRSSPANLPAPKSPRFAGRPRSARTLASPMERFGFVGLPNAGKSSLYNALAGGGALAAPYAFATTDPNVGMARVPDPRLDALAEMSQSKNVVPATVQFVDIGGLVAGASKGEGLGNKFLSHIREVDAIVFVLRAFADDDVPGPVRPARAPRRRRARAHLRRPRDGREPDREAPQGGQGRQVARRRGGRARPGQGRSSRRARRSTAPT